MTKINKIVMQGFKSFAKRTELIFSDHYNCVLGPNGSGKSNVLDAVCFVLGKSSAKGLRAEKSSNLIYNGGKTKKAAKEGEVSIYFDNAKKAFPTEEPAIKITRTITDKGQSKYRINDKPRTRQQVLDLLSAAKIDPEGYNIILQGDIVRFVEMSTIERRMIIEEIAGIGIYEDKKQKALKELEKVDGKLGEAEIILKERKTYLKELKEDRDQALKYKEVNDRITQNKASYLKLQINKKEEEKKKTDEAHEKNKQVLDKKLEKIKQHKQEIEKNRAEIQTLTKEVEEKGEKEQIALQKEIEQTRVNIATAKTRLSSLENEAARIKQRKEQLQKNVQEIKTKIAELKAQLQAIEKEREAIESEQKGITQKIDAFKQKHNIDKDTAQIEQRMEQLDRDSEELQREVQKLREEQQESLRKKDKTEFQLQTIDNQIAKLQEVEREHKKELDELKLKREEFKNTVKELNRHLEESSKTARELQELGRELFTRKEALEKLSLQQTRVYERKAGSLAVKKILEEKKQFGLVFGTVAQLGKAQSKYTQALEVAGGARINNIIVENDSVASKCIDYLKRNRLGIATFLPLNKLRPAPIDQQLHKLKKEKGVHGLAVELIHFDSQFEKAFQYVFGSTLIIDDIEVARRIGIGSARMCTLTGDLIELSGAMQGGFREKKGAFQEEDVSADITKLEKEIARMQGEAAVLRQKQDETEERIVKLRVAKAGLEGEIIKTEKGLHLKSEDFDASKQYKEQLEAEGKETNKKIGELGEEITGKNKKLTEMKVERSAIKERISKLRSPSILAELSAFEQKHRELAERLSAINTEAKGINMQINEILGRDLENTGKILKELDKEQGQFQEETSQLQAKAKQEAITLKEREELQEKSYVKFKEIYARRARLNEEITRIEQSIEELIEKSRKDEYEMNSASLELARIKAELAGFSEEFAQYDGVQLDLTKSEQELKKEIREYEKMKENIGSVNLRALDIYDAVEKEFNILMEKKESLQKEQKDVMAMMTEIESRKIDLFMKNFDNINEHFKQIFLQLSVKGEAYLDLENTDKPFEAGVQFRVRLTGNKFMDIRSLSGGEKTMTALAFIFAIQEYEPASFYVLDEVDAALDKHNSEKFAKLIRKYAEKAQYIIISHNDSVVSEADSLYGVSMNEHGISNVVSLKI
ncbi:MAG: chromosome segregation protein SMC [Candidatus Woesearchaeota archaeon]